MKIRQAAVFVNEQRAGLLRQETSRYVFEYDAACLAAAHLPAVSLSLPKTQRVRRLLTNVVGHEAAVEQLLRKSFLSTEMRDRYAASLANRRQRWRYSLAGAAWPPGPVLRLRG